jgi:phosphate-selective porin OprO and OprP
MQTAFRSQPNPKPTKIRLERCGPPSRRASKPDRCLQFLVSDYFPSACWLSMDFRPSTPVLAKTCIGIAVALLQALQSNSCIIAQENSTFQQTPSSIEIRQAVPEPIAISSAANPTDPTAPLTADQAQIQALLARIDALEKSERERQAAEEKKLAGDKVKKEEEDAKKRQEAEMKIDSGWTDVSDEKWTVKLGGHVQTDYINWADADAAIPGTQDYFEFRRLRLVADGTGYGVYDFRLQMTLEPETVGENAPGVITSPDVKDAYFSVNEIPLLGRWRIGNFFVPFSLEQVTNDTNNIFMERSIPTQGIFAADREVGMAVYNCTANQRVSWASGIFFDGISDSLKERIDDNQGYRLSGRLTFLPYYDEPSNGRYLVHTGVGILHTDDQDNRIRFRARPQIHEGPRLIDSGVLAADSNTTGNLELAIVWGRTTLQSEAFASNVNFLSGDTQTVSGAYVHSSFFLTGENRIYEKFGQHGPQFGRNKPYSNAFAVPGFVSWGAWEAKARWSYLDLTKVDAGQYNDLSLGMNWYWSDRTRVMFDWIHPFTSADSSLGATEADILATRFDFNW